MAEPLPRRGPSATASDTAPYRRRVARFLAGQPELVDPQRWDDPDRPAPARPLLAALGAAGLLAPTHAGEPSASAAALWHSTALHQEMARPGGAAGAVVLTHTEVAVRLLARCRTGADPVADAILGRRTAALAVTEPSGGTDFDAMRTTVRGEGGTLVLDGEKWFSSNAPIADDLFVLARDLRLAAGAIGRHTLLRVRTDAAGVSVGALRTLGHRGLTGHIVLDHVVLDGTNVVGPAGTGLLTLLRHWPHERVMLAVRLTALARVTVRSALDHLRRNGRDLAPLADLVAATEQEHAAVHHAVGRLAAGDCPPELAAGCKYRAAALLVRAAEETLLLCRPGRAGAVPLAERMLRDGSGLTLAGGSDEAMLIQIGRAL